MSIEQRYVDLVTGGATSLLMTDGYKFSMAQAGFPLRRETFYLSCRRGGPLLVPFDLVEVVRRLVASIAEPTGVEREFLSAQGYDASPAMLAAALSGEIEVASVPTGVWVGDREPIVTVTGPSFLVSWLEPLAIMLHFPLQIAAALSRQDEALEGWRASCSTEAAIVELVAEACGVTGIGPLSADEGGYRAGVKARVEAIVEALGGQGTRAFEVGLRSASCLAMHRVAIEVASEGGIGATSNVDAACALDLAAVGTTGHEHQQRWLDDESAFRAVRDMRVGSPSYLFDTYDALERGIPATVRVMAEDLERASSVRFDSGDQDEQLRRFLAAEAEHGIGPRYIFEDGYTAERTRRNEASAEKLGIAPERRLYGYGGHIVVPSGFDRFSRNAVSAVYKLTRTGPIPVMKFVGAKSSVPGRPVLLRSSVGESSIAQEGETLEGFEVPEPGSRPEGPCRHSPATAGLIEVCRERVRCR